MRIPYYYKITEKDIDGLNKRIESIYSLIASSINRCYDLIEKQKARARRNNSYTTSSSTWTKFPIDKIDFDPNNIVDLLNSRIKPTKPGYYIVHGQISLTSPTDLVTNVYKNGNPYARGTSFTSNESHYDSVVSCLVYLDGSSDYIELWYYSTGSKDLFITDCTNFIDIIGPFI